MYSQNPAGQTTGQFEINSRETVGCRGLWTGLSSQLHFQEKERWRVRPKPGRLWKPRSRRLGGENQDQIEAGVFWRPGSGGCGWSVMGGEAGPGGAEGPSVSSKMVAGPAFLRRSRRAQELGRRTEQIAPRESHLPPAPSCFSSFISLTISPETLGRCYSLCPVGSTDSESRRVSGHMSPSCFCLCLLD